MKDQDGTSKGSAFIRFKNKEDALLAMRFLNGNVYLGGSDKPIEVRFAENKKKTATQAEHTQGQSFRSSTPSTMAGAFGGAAPMNPMNPMTVRGL